MQFKNCSASLCRHLFHSDCVGPQKPSKPRPTLPSIWKGIRTLKKRSSIYLAATMALAFIPYSAQAQSTVLGFNSLPTSQGWTYVFETRRLPKPPFFSVSDSTLHQNTLGIGNHEAYFERRNFADPTKSFVFSMRSRTLAEDSSRDLWLWIWFLTRETKILFSFHWSQCVSDWVADQTNQLISTQHYFMTTVLRASQTATSSFSSIMFFMQLALLRQVEVAIAFISAI